MLIRINNAQAVGREQVFIPFSNIKSKIAQILKENGMISDTEKRNRKGKKSELNYLLLTLKYGDDKKPGIRGFKIISRPSRHLYVKSGEIKSVRSGYGLGVISTSKGIMSSKDARKQNLGGELLFEVW